MKESRERYENGPDAMQVARAANLGGFLPVRDSGRRKPEAANLLPPSIIVPRKPDARWLRSTCAGPRHHVSTVRGGLFRLGLIHGRIARHEARTENHPRGNA